MSEVGEGPKCPYNSIYATFESRNKDKKPSIVCCEHGKPCAQSEKNKKKEETASYVNLMKEGSHDKSTKEVAEPKIDKLTELAMRLREVEMKSAKRQKREKRNKEKQKNQEEKSEKLEKSEKKAKKQREMVKMDKIMNDAADLTFIEESDGTKVGDNISQMEKKELSKAISFLKTDPENSVSKKKNKKKESQDFIRGPATERSVTFVSDSENRRLKKKKPEEHAVPKKAKYVVEGETNRSMYIGIISKSAAERSLDKPTDFRIYHQAKKFNNLDELSASIKLYLVSKTDEGFRHDQIRQAFSPSGKKSFYINRGEKTMMFKTVEELVSYYQVQARISPEEFLM